MNNREKEFVLFDRYAVDIGKCGKVTVKSKAQFNKPLKVYGKKKDGLRFVNLKNLENVTEGYDLEDIKNHFLYGCDLFPLSQEQLNDANKYESLPDIIEDALVIQQLPTTKDRFGTIQHYQETSDYNVYYQRVNYTNLSNGFEKYHYNVVMSNKWNPYTVTKRTEMFCNESKVIISDWSRISDKELSTINQLLNDEIKRREEENNLES